MLVVLQNWRLIEIRPKKIVFLFWEVWIRSSWQITSVSVFDFWLPTKCKCSMIENQLRCKCRYLHLVFWTRVSLYGIRSRLAVGSVHQPVAGGSCWRASLQLWSSCARCPSVCLWYCGWQKKFLPGLHLLGEENYAYPKHFNGGKLILKPMEDV